MKGNRSKVQLLIILILLGFTVGIHAFKLPINLRRNIVPQQPESESRLQLNLGQDDYLSDTTYRRSLNSEKALLFPQNGDENESVEYKVRLLYENQNETPKAEQLKGLERFYKYVSKSRPEGEEVIVFPKDAIQYVHDQKGSGGRTENIDDFEVDSRSNDMPSASDYIKTGTVLRESDKNTNYTTNQLSETLAYIVRQLLLRLSVTETPPQIKSADPTTIQVYASSTESVLDVHFTPAQEYERPRIARKV